MSNTLYWMVTIIDRNQSRKFLSFYRNYGISVVLSTLGHGTAASNVLNYFSLEATQKAVLCAVVTDTVWNAVKKGLETIMQIDIPGTGVAFVVPVSSVGGKRQLQFITSGMPFTKGEESVLKDTKYELLVVVANQGYTETIMEAARRGKAAGGTMIHAKGTGMEGAEKFLGVSLAAEKELIFIVVRREQKNEVMSAIMEDAGIETRAGAIVFSVPVTSTAGLRLTDLTADAE
ncbi:MAG TPA: P-II family nitrogen regulator [Candidatus Ruminococcus gallistercoris]|jgi:nitrogen regulatory protein PII|nr:P-II family nitrogen regulator [Acutalibacteraceae bacterium]HJB60705.1 P-II family nitrogen regulator [Candidatus Ruminococcus gallistercoris]